MPALLLTVLLLLLVGCTLEAQNDPRPRFERRDVPTPSQPYNLEDVDLDGDGDVDLATVDQTSNTVTMMLNDGSARFTTGGVTGVGESPPGIVSGDLDGDGDHDLVVSDFRGASVSLLTNDGQGASGGRPH